MAGGRRSSHVTIEEVADLLGLPAWDDVSEANADHTGEVGHGTYKQALADGASEAEAEEAGLAAQDAAMDEVYANWHGAVESVAEALFREHGLVLAPASARGGRHPYDFDVAPAASWRDAAARIMDTIHGVGMFEFGSLREFLDSGPYTPREAVLAHLHWIKDRPAVYGEPRPRRMYERAWR